MRILSKQRAVLAAALLCISGTDAGKGEPPWSFAATVEEGATNRHEDYGYGPSVIHHEADSIHQDIIVDVVSIGSEMRPDYLQAQVNTWASHAAVRNFWGFTELQNLDGRCLAMSNDAMESHVKTCKNKNIGFNDPAIKRFIHRNYGSTEGGVNHRKAIGWICAQRRPGRALAWLQNQYGGHHNDNNGDDENETSKTTMEVPDMLMIVDDDTYLDVDLVKKYMIMGESEHQPLARAACVFESTRLIPFSFAYGGFGTFLNKDAIHRLIKPILCKNDNELDNKGPCSRLKENRIGEFDFFEEGMSTLELFYKYSTIQDYCMHSDWLLGYMIKYYIFPQGLGMNEESSSSSDQQNELLGMKTYPSCGNFTATNDIRPCLDNSASCHKQTPKDMESLALSSYVRMRSSSFNGIPHLAATETNEVSNMIAEKEGTAQPIVLPNVLLIGAQKAATTSLAEWLFSGGVCRPANLEKGLENKYYKEVHFFDENDRYKQGVEFYSKRFQHCGIDDFILDATPGTLMSPERVFETYSSAAVGAGHDNDFVSRLKMIVILREPVSREMSLYNHKTVEFLKTQRENDWYSDVAFANNGTIMSFDQYSTSVLKDQLSKSGWKSTGKYVDYLKLWVSYFDRDQLLVLSYDELKQDPEKVQWRVQQFLGGSFRGGLPHHNDKPNENKDKFVPEHASRVLKPLFSKKNQELYQFLKENPGRWMEQSPFPHFESEKTTFAYATMLGWNPDESQNQVYLEAVLVWIYRLRESGTDADIVIMMAYNDPKKEEILKAAGAIVKHIDPIPHTHDIEHTQHIEQFESWFVNITLAKLRAFQLTDYERVQLMDVDVAIEEGKNLDVLFLNARDSRVVSKGLGGDSPLRAGWMLLKPSNKTFSQLENIVENEKNDERPESNSLFVRS